MSSLGIDSRLRQGPGRGRDGSCRTRGATSRRVEAKFTVLCMVVRETTSEQSIVLPDGVYMAALPGTGLESVRLERKCGRCLTGRLADLSGNVVVVLLGGWLIYRGE